VQRGGLAWAGLAGVIPDPLKLQWLRRAVFPQAYPQELVFFAFPDLAELGRR